MHVENTCVKLHSAMGYGAVSHELNVNESVVYSEKVFLNRNIYKMSLCIG